MAYTKVTRTENGTSALSYVLNGKGHNGAHNRNELVTPIKMYSGISFQTQMERYWDRARSNHKTQIIRIVQSFSKNEFDPSNPADILKANELGQTMVDEHYPGRQALVCTQTDGKSGCVHNHILVNDVSMIDSKGCVKEQYYQPVLKTWTDDITSRYTNLDQGNNEHENLTQTERAKRENNEYSYKDDIRERVSAAMKKSVSEEDFINRLRKNGVNTVKRYNKKHGSYYTYELIDRSAIPEGAKLPNHSLCSRSYKLGTAYEPHALMEQLEVYERVLNQSKTADSDVDYTPKISTKKAEVPKVKTETPKENPEQHNEFIISSLSVSPAETVTGNIHDDIRKALENADEEELIANKKPAHKTPRPTTKPNTTQKPKKKIDANRFNRYSLGTPSTSNVSKDHNDGFGCK